MNKKYWRLILEQVRNKHGLDDSSLLALSREVRVQLVKEAEEDIQKGIIKEYGSLYGYQNHCAQRDGYKNRGERDKEQILSRGFISLYEYKTFLAHKRGFASTHEYKDYLARKSGFKSRRERELSWATHRQGIHEVDYLKWYLSSTREYSSVRGSSK